jgi:hypothetical protein
MPTAEFYKFSKRKNSTKQPTGSGTSYTVNLKSGTSFIRPTLLLEISGQPDYNYLEFEGWYYFVTDIISVRNDLWEIVCQVDPLATAKAAILASTQYVSYSSVSGGVWLPDTRIPVTKETLVSSNSSLTGILSTIGCYILTVVGKSACISYVIQSEGVLSSILNEIQNWRDDGINTEFTKLQNPSSSYSSPTIQSVGSSATEGQCFNALFQQLADAFDSLGNAFTDIQDKIGTTLASVGDAAIGTGFVGNAYQNAPQCIRSCIWVPFDAARAPGASGVSSSIYLGVYDTQETGTPITSECVTGSNTVTIPWHYSDWRRGVCEDVYMYLPLVGLVPISGDSITNASTITINWSVTYTDGVIDYKLEAGGEVIGTYSGQCASNYPLGLAQQASAGEVFQALIGGVEKMASTAITAGSSLNPAAWAVGGVSLGMEAFNTSYDVANASNTTHVSCVGGVGGGAGIGLGRDCICYTVAHPTIVSPATMQATMGIPTMKPLTLSSCTGYCQCANAHVETDLPAPIIDAVDSFLNSGFFIE